MKTAAIASREQIERPNFGKALGHISDNSCEKTSGKGFTESAKIYIV